MNDKEKLQLIAKKYELILSKLQNSTVLEQKRIYKKMFADLTNIIDSLQWNDPYLIKTALGRVQKNFNKNLNIALYSQISEAQLAAFKKFELELPILLNVGLDGETLKKALDLYSRKVATQINKEYISTRIWNINKPFFDNLKREIDKGFLSGISAMDLSDKIKGLINNPLPVGRGIYRSAEANAYRLTRTEIKRAYQLQENAQAQSLPFISGIQVNLSKSHPKYDMCNELMGVYPPDFVFGGWHPNCYSIDTEIFTKKGWKYFYDLSFEDEILSFNPDNYFMEFVKIKNLIKYFYNGKMVNFKNFSLDLLVTPDHKIIYKSKRNEFKNDKTANDFSKNNGSLIRTAKWQGENIESIILGDYNIHTDLFCEFIGYYLSEGSFSRKYAVNISQSENVNPEKYLKIETLLKQMPFKFSENKMGFNFYDKTIWNYVKQFGKSPDKFVPEIIKQLTPEKIQIFLDAFNLGDGSKRPPKIMQNRDKKTFSNNKGEITYSTSSVHLMNDLTELIVKIGQRPSFALVKSKGKKISFKNGDYNIKNNQFIINQRISKSASDFKKEYVDYNNFVFDVELEKNHTLFVRRNNKCVWGSNCICYTTFVRPPKEEVKKIINEGGQATPVDMPANYFEYLDKNKERFEKKPPLFLTENLKISKKT